jgi:phosphoribosylformylglycinamidine cyclo-ligase
MKYKDAGVDLRAARRIKAEIKKVARSTLNEKVLWSVGAFGAGYELNDGHILVSSTDSVGTKILIARMVNEHHSIGQDIVNHCVNDILCQGAQPLFFMDYIAGSTLARDVVIELVEGIGGLQENRDSTRGWRDG